MRHAVCLEEMEGGWIAHVPVMPGCFASAAYQQTALDLLPAAINDYLAWRSGRGDLSVTVDNAISVEVEEIIRQWPHPADPSYVVNAFFAADAAPLTAGELKQWARLLEWSRADLLATVADLPPRELNRPVEGEWTVGGILNHTGRAEWWYLSQLNLAPPREQQPDNWRERLEMIRDQLMGALPHLEGLARIEMSQGELWSPRKVLRRTLWHERDHTQHILKFRAMLGV